MRLRVYWLVFLICFWTASCPRAHAETLDDVYLSIFLKMHAAEQLEKQGDYRGALADYTDCYEQLEKIHKSNPDWEPALVVKRMDDCGAKMSELERLAVIQPPNPPATNVVTPEPGATPPIVDTTNSGLSTDVTVLQQEVLGMKEELEGLKLKYQGSLAEIQTLKQQNLALNEQYQSLKNQQSVDNRIGNLMTQNTALTDKLAAAEQELDELKANPKSTLAMVRAQLKNAKDQLAQTESQNEALQQTATTLKQQLDQAQDALASANQKLETVATGTPQYEQLKRDNEIMRDILTRELQEQAHRDMAVRLYQEEYDRLKINSRVLEEQLDIIRTPMTPPTNDQERALLDSLRVSSTGLAQASPAGGNGFTAPAAGADTNSPSVVTTTNPAPSPPVVVDTDPTTTNTTATTNATDTNSISSSPATTGTGSTPAPAIVADDNTSQPSTSGTPAATATNTMTDSNNASQASSVVATSTNQTTADPTTTNSSSAPAPPDVATSNTVAMNSSVPPGQGLPSNADNAPPASGDTVPTSVTAPGGADNSNTPEPGSTQAATTTNSPTENGGGSNGASSQQDPESYAKQPRLPDDMHDTAQAAADLFKMGRYDEAAAKYQTIIDKYPESLYAWSNLGVVRFQQKNYDAALKALQQAVKLSPADSFSYKNLGIVYYQMGQYDSAISALEKALALEPDDAKSHNYLGCACSQKGWQEVAEKEFLKAISIDDEFGDAHFNLALVYATEKPPSLELARRHYNRAQELGIARDDRLEKLLQIPQ